MATQVQWRGGSTSEHSTFTGAAREVTVDTQKKTLVVHDGSTAGGHPLQKQYPVQGSKTAPTYTFSGDTNTGIYSPGADQVAISTNGQGRLFVASDGKVGVGTETPNGTFDIYNLAPEVLFTDSNNPAAYCRIRGSDAGSLNIDADFGNAGLNSTLIFGVDGSERARITSDGTVNIKGAGTAGVTQAVSFSGSAPVNSLYVQATTGNVGLGTANPASLLHIEGTGSIVEGRIRNNTSTAGQKAALYLTTSTVSTFNSAGIEAIRNSGNTDELAFIQGSTEKARIDGSGTFRVKGAGTAGTTDAVQLNGSAPANSLLLDASGRLLVGTTGAYQIGSTNSAIQVRGTGPDSAGLSISRFSDNGASGYLSIGKARGSIATPVIVDDDDTIGTIQFAAYDGSDLATSAAQITAEVDGNPGANNMPGRLVFSTNGGSPDTSPTPRMTIKNNGIVNIANAPTYADNAAATSGGLAVGDVYRTSTGQLMIRY